MAAGIFVAVVCAALTFVGNADANINFSGTPPMSVSSNVPGAHASMTVTLNLDNGAGNDAAGGDDVKRIVSDIAPGFIGDPTAIPAAQRCNLTPPTSASGPTPDYGSCPSSAIVGTISANANLCYLLFPNPFTPYGCDNYAIGLSGNIYQLRNPGTNGAPEVPTYLGIHLVSALGETLADPIDLTAKITISNKDNPSIGRVEDFAMRFELIENAPQSASTLLGTRTVTMTNMSMTFNALTQAGVPFMTNPTRCTPWTTKFYARAWNANTNANVDIDPSIAGNDHVLASSTITPNCGGALGAFNPDVTMQAIPSKTDSPAALRVIVTNAEATTAAGLQSSHIKRMDMTMPDGFEVNPMMANAITDSSKVCSYAQFSRADTDTTNSCPAESKLGTITLDTPMLSVPLTGGLYLGPPGSTDADRFKLFFALDDATNTVKTKGEGRAYVNHTTGEVTATLGDPAVDAGKSLPAFLWTKMQLDFKSGPTAMMTNPRSCGTHTGSVDFTPWMSPTQSNVVRHPTVSVSYDGAGAPCPAEPFSPTATLSVSDTTAGAHADVTTTIKVPAHNQDLARSEMRLPAGMGAALDTVAKCSQVDADAGNCAANTKVGSVEVRVGNDEGDADAPGTNLVKITGSMYNTVPDTVPGHPELSKPAAFTAVVPAAVGPFDLGKVIVPVDITINKDMSFNAVTPEVPTRMLGIPVRMRKLAFTLFKQVDGVPFMTNPTVCGTKQVTAKLWSAQHPEEAAGFSTSADFTITGCPKNFSTASPPTFSFTPDNTEVGRPVGLTTTLAIPAPYDPSASEVTVAMPAGMRINPAMATDVDSCPKTDVDAGAVACPANSQLGSVEFTTPLLSGTFYGKIWLVESGVGPDERYRIAFTVQLPGQQLIAYGETKVDGSSDLPGGLGNHGGSGQVTVTFRDIPQVYFNSFTMILNGGTKSLLTNDTECGTSTATATITPQTTNPSPITLTDSFTTSQDGHGAACPDAKPLAPTISASLSSYQAGASPNLDMQFDRPDKNQNVKSLRIQMPPGFVGSPSAVPTCSSASAAAGTCTDASKVGSFDVTVGLSDSNYTVAGKIFNTQAPADRPAALTAIVPVVVGPFDLGRMVLPIDVQLDPDDYSLIAQTGEIPQMYEGVPVRAVRLNMTMDGVIGGQNFLLNPHRCYAGSVHTRVVSHEGGTVDVDSPLPQAFTGCGSLNLDGAGNGVALTNLPTTTEHPTTLTADVTEGSGPTQATISSLTVGLPGFRINAVGAKDVTACDAAALSTNTCPAASRIGDAWIDTPLLPELSPGAHSLTGGVYLETPGTAADGSDRYRLAIVFSGRTTIVVRGRAVVDENTGEVGAVFDELPDLPFSAMRMALSGHSNPMLLNPTECGSVAATAHAVSWAGATRDFSPALTVDGCSGGAKPFSPALGAQFSTLASGAHPDVTFTITRPEGQQNLKAVQVDLPPGFVGSASAVPLCAVADAQAGNCAQASRIGSVLAKIGAAGQTPAGESLDLTGSMYLTAGAAGDIAGVAVKLPAVAGPYDLGDYVTLGRIKLRPSDHGLTANFDGLPLIYKGVPTPIREMQVTMFGTAPSTGRPFMYNASSCGAMDVAASFVAHEGAVSGPSEVPYQAVGCDGRSFGPQIALTAHGGGPRVAPAWTIAMTSDVADATLAGAKVVLPSIVTVNVQGLGNACSADAAAARACPAASRVGTVSIDTPLLPDPVVGTVYMARSVTGASLPDLLLEFPAPIDMQIRGANRFVNGNQIESTFSGLPDLVYTNMSMQIEGGATGLITVRDNALCGSGAGSYLSHSGQSSASGVPVRGIWACGGDTGCDVPTVTASTKGVKRRKAQVGLKVAVPPGCAAMKSLTVTFPKGTKISRQLLKNSKKNRKNVTAKAGAKSLTVKDFAPLGRNAIKLRKPLAGDAHSISLTFKRGVVALPWKSFCVGLKGARRSKCRARNVTFSVKAKRADGSTTTYKYAVKAGDKRFK